MKVFITGALGNVGCLLIDALLERGCEITAFDLKTKVNEKVSAAYLKKVKIVWGDINEPSSYRECLREQDVLIHLAAIVPPHTEERPELARRVNVDGTEKLLQQVNDLGISPLIVYASSFAVFGHDQTIPPPRKVSDPLVATDNYSSHKVECENLIQDKAARWVIVRLAACLDSRQRHASKESVKFAFSTRAQNRIEYIHPKDVALAIVNSLSREEAWNKIHLLGGGKDCQITHMILINTMMGAAGMQFKESDFGREPFYTDWLDTSESQRILEYQNFTFEDFKKESFHSMRFIRLFIKPIAPIVKYCFQLWLRF